MSSSHLNGAGDQVASENGWGPREPATQPPAGIADIAATRPEVAVGAAFVGGLVLALLLRRVRS